MRTGADPYGRPTCSCRSQGSFNCDCPRRYADPWATFGWDSYLQQYYYGHTVYLLTTYNPQLKVDLPVFLKTVSAKRHDSVTALFALAEFRTLAPQLNLTGFISDSACDNYATYHLLKKWQLPAFIALNQRMQGNFTYGQIECDQNGTPLCAAGLKMINCGRDNTRDRTKFRCPVAAGKCASCPLGQWCSKSAYGRVVYTKNADNPRFFTDIPRHSKHWREVMKQRTAIERNNKQILQDYGLDHTRVRTRSRLTLWVTMAMMLIHLKAQSKQVKAQ